MNSVVSAPAARESWQQSLRETVRDPQELCRLLELDSALVEPARAAAADFALRVPREFIARMRKGDPDDPLLRQVLPLAAEGGYVAGFGIDPLGERHHNPRPGLIHKYHGRVLLIVSGGCAVNCRYCFRRHFPYVENTPGREAWQQSLDYIAERPQISEVILSGGDPLTLSDAQLGWLIERLAEIPHLRRLRLHTRLPIMIPSRMTPALLQVIGGSRLQPVMVLHCNHAQEVDASVVVALQALREQQISVLNQAVLLAGVNDSVEALADLGETLFRHGVLPYYLHLLDRVAGAAHFEVGEVRAQELRIGLLARLPGYLVPRFVREIDGEANKTAL